MLHWRRVNKCKQHLPECNLKVSVQSPSTTRICDIPPSNKQRSSPIRGLLDVGGGGQKGLDYLTGVLGTITVEKEREKEKRRERVFLRPRGLLVLSKIHAQAEKDASALILPDSKCHQNLNYMACSLSRSMRVCFNLYRPLQTAAEEPVGAKEGEWGLRGGKWCFCTSRRLVVWKHQLSFSPPLSYM